EEGLQPIAITFDPDPDRVVHPELPPPALCSLAERRRMLASLGAQVDVVPFTREVSLETAEEFLGRLQQRYAIAHLWVGEDFALGHERQATVEQLRELGRRMGFAVSAVPLLEHEGRPITSTWIRHALADGDVRLAAALLGRPYCVEGVVEPGAQRGRQIGFPTANVLPPPGRALPADGVYFVEVRVRRGPDGSEAGQEETPAYGVVNLGSCPTFDEAERLIETHVLDFQGDLYGARLSVSFIEQLRGIRRFAGIEELKTQIERDVAQARQMARLRH